MSLAEYEQQRRDQLVNRIVGNEYGRWWNAIVRRLHENRLKDQAWLREQAFRAGVEAGLSHPISSNPKQGIEPPTHSTQQKAETE